MLLGRNEITLGFKMLVNMRCGHGRLSYRKTFHSCEHFFRKTGAGGAKIAQIIVIPLQKFRIE